MTVDNNHRAEQVHQDDRPVVLPFYLLVDVSGSMGPYIGNLNAAMDEFRDTLAQTPVLADKVQFGIIDFADDARTVVPLGDFSSANLEANRLRARGGTNYAAAFTKLRQVIEADVATGTGLYKYFRPAVFMLTDGAPTSAWETAFAHLTQFNPATGQGFKSYPLFVPFGMGAADAQVLTRLVHPQDRSVLFMADAGTSPTEAINKMTKAMLQSMLSSGRTVKPGHEAAHVLPTQNDVGPGITVYPGGNFVN